MTDRPIPVALEQRSLDGRDRRSLLLPRAQSVVVRYDELHLRIRDVAARHVDPDHAEFLADKIVLAERMGVPTHGLHYFLHSLLPHLREGNVNDPPMEVSGSVVLSIGTGGVGFLNLHRCLMRASDLAREHGVALAVLKLPGKVGALRVFCQELMDRDQIVIMVKNTARTVGVAETREPAFGTNPLCIGLPGTGFIYDSTMATIATNKVRLMRKTGQRYPVPIGLDRELNATGDPAAMMAAGGYLLPFSHGPFWFKSFFLGIAIEALAAFAGGGTGRRTGEHTGTRLHSREGMQAIVLDRRSSPDYDAYVGELRALLGELEEQGLRVPGDYDRAGQETTVLEVDWHELQSL